MNTDANMREGADADEAAAEWFHRLAAAQGAKDAAETRRAFQRWLEADPDHAVAFARSAAIWDEVGAHAAAPEMMSLREAAIADARAAAQSRWRLPARAEPNRWRAVAAVYLVGAIGLGVAGYFYLQPKPPPAFATSIGERRSVVLADNSRVDIDADSAISVEYSPERRAIHLLRGQAYFQVEKDPARPFVVDANGRSVVATGTQFDVEALDKGMRVTLVEGRVVVRLPAGGSRQLLPNDQLTDVSGERPALVRLPSTLAETAWRQGKLLFDNEPIAEAVARIDRYSPMPVVADPSVASIRIGGAFDAGDIRAFVGAVTAYYPVDAVYDKSGDIRLVRRQR